jgi:hypothetical protein
MSDKAKEEFDKVRDEILKRQTKCSWCEKICDNANHLYIHIILRHKQEEL